MTYLEKLVAELKAVLVDHTCDVSGSTLLRSYTPQVFAELQQSHRAIDRVQRLLAEISLESEAKKAPMTVTVSTDNGASWSSRNVEAL